jgi:flagellar motor component MotA
MNEKDFITEYNAIFERSIIFTTISRSMGLVSLENILDKKKYSQRDIFEYGMRLVLDGRPPEFIDKILSNIINLETEKEKIILKKIQKDVVLSIQQGISPEEIMLIMNSYVNIELDEASEKYKEIHEYITKEIINEFNKYQEKLADIYKHISEKIFNKYNKTI